MAKRGDEVKVGVMVMGAGAILIVTVFMMIRYNPFQPSYDEYLIQLKFAGGLERDSIVRFGGMRRGKVVSVRLAPGTAQAIEIQLSLQKGTPIKTDSVARLASLNALGENYVEITLGREDSPLLAPGQTIRSEETPEFSELLAKINGLSEDARILIGDLGRKLNRISDSADTLLANLNDATGPSEPQSPGIDPRAHERDDRQRERPDLAHLSQGGCRCRQSPVGKRQAPSPDATR